MHFAGLQFPMKQAVFHNALSEVWPRPDLGRADIQPVPLKSGRPIAVSFELSSAYLLAPEGD
jgi:hypothetical protein